MPYTSPPTKLPGQVIEASYLNTLKMDLDDHEMRVADVETAIGAGNVTGPGTSTDNAIARYNGAGGTSIQDSGITIADAATGTLSGSNSGDVTLAGTPNYITVAAQVITRALIDLASHVTGRLPFANLVASTSANRLIGRGSTSGAGDFQEIALGAGLSLSGTTLSATGAGAGALDDLTDVVITTPALDDVLQYDGAGWVNQSIAGSAPTSASYVTLGTNVTLTSERVLTAGTGIALADAGAGSTLTVSTTSTPSGGGADPNSSIYPPFTPAGDDDEFNDGSFSGWTAVNSGANNPTITETNNRASFLLPGGDAAAELHAYMKSGHSSTNDWIEVAFSHNGPTQSYNLFGCLFADGTSYGAGLQVAFGVSPSLTQLPYYSYTNYNAASVISSPGSDVGFPQGVCFLRFKYLGSNSWQGYTSPDGISWAAVGVPQARTMTPTHIGFWMTTWGGNGQHVWSVLYVKFGNG